MEQTLDTHGRQLGLSEWGRLPEDEPGELVDDRLVEEEVPTIIHEAVLIWLVLRLGPWIATRGGLLLGSGTKYAVGTRHGRKPDLSAFFAGRMPAADAPVVEIAPDIAVEIVSSSPGDERRDRIDKVSEYAAFGIRYYWIVDPALRSVEVLELGPTGKYIHALGASRGTLTAIPGCDGLMLELDMLWAEIDRVSGAPH